MLSIIPKKLHLYVNINLFLVKLTQDTSIIYSVVKLTETAAAIVSESSTMAICKHKISVTVDAGYGTSYAIPN